MNEAVASSKKSGEPLTWDQGQKLQESLERKNRFRFFPFWRQKTIYSGLCHRKSCLPSFEDRLI